MGVEKRQKQNILQINVKAKNWRAIVAKTSSYLTCGLVNCHASKSNVSLSDISGKKGQN